MKRMFLVLVDHFKIQHEVTPLECCRIEIELELQKNMKKKWLVNKINIQLTNNA